MFILHMWSLCYVRQFNKILDLNVLMEGKNDKHIVWFKGLDIKRLHQLSKCILEFMLLQQEFKKPF